MWLNSYVSLEKLLNGKPSKLYTGLIAQSEAGGMIWYDIIGYDIIWYICQLQLGKHPVAVVQYTFTHKQYIEQHK